MLYLHHTRGGEPRLYVQHPAVSAEAWIEHHHSLSFRSGPDWVLWYRRSPSRPACAAKCQLRLEIESALRAWLLRAYHRRLYDLAFRDLCALAEAPRRYHRPHQVR